MAVASPTFSTSSIKAKCRDKEAKLPKTQRIIHDVDGSCIAVTADPCFIPIGKGEALTIRNTRVPDRSQIRMFPLDRIEFNSIIKKKKKSTQK